MDFKESVTFPIKEKPDDFSNVIHNVYTHIHEKLSKEIFEDRLMYSLTNDYYYIRRLITRRKEGTFFVDYLKRVQENSPIYIYGAGINGTRVVSIYPDINWGGYIDKNKRGCINGLKIYDLNQFSRIKDSYCLISNSVNPNEIVEELKTNFGLVDNRIIVLRDFNNDNDIYFEEIIINRLNNMKGCFVDIGSYDGGDSLRFLKITNYSVPIIAIEADPENYSVCSRKLSGYENVRVLQLGLSDFSGEKCFGATGTSSARFKENGSKKVRVETLDSVCDGEDISFIKMDIEGAEEEALLGAKEVITKNKRILAISIYHRRKDIWILPKLILDMYDSYEFYLRHYTVGTSDTVLYAIPV